MVAVGHVLSVRESTKARWETCLTAETCMVMKITPTEELFQCKPAVFQVLGDGAAAAVDDGFQAFYFHVELEDADAPGADAADFTGIAGDGFLVPRTDDGIHESADALLELAFALVRHGLDAGDGPG